MQIFERLNAVFHCAGYSQNSMIGLTFRADSHQHQHQIETFLSCAGCLRIIHFPYPNILIPSSFLVSKQMSSVFAKHTLTFLFCEWMNTNISINTSFKYIYVYCLQYLYVCVCGWVCVCNVCISKIPCHQKKVPDALRNLRTEHLLNGTILSVVQTVVAPWASSRRGSLVGRGISQFSLLTHPNRSLPSQREVRRGLVPGPLWQRDTSQGARGGCHSQENLSAGRSVMTNQQAQPEWLFMPMSQPGQFGSVAHIVVPVWLGPGVLASSERRTKLNPPHASHSTVLLSAWWLSLRLLINISLLTEPGKRSQQNVIWRLEVKGKGM